ncbi:hypothetical protein, partial [Marininema halotolerans]|uniref:hypothetical protein n=1 Tax=Marininema halotolerans TaxID=1155944 RepID=UPI001C3E4ACE
FSFFFRSPFGFCLLRGPAFRRAAAATSNNLSRILSWVKHFFQLLLPVDRYLIPPILFHKT